MQYRSRVRTCKMEGCLLVRLSRTLHNLLLVAHLTSKVFQESCVGEEQQLADFESH